jgi:desulfoferrodoxin (superoxide reductase-like protein)
MKFICIISIFLFLSCNNDKKESITLNVLNDTLVTYPINSTKDTANIIKYSLENNSDESIYINNQFGYIFNQSLVLNDRLLQINITNNNEIVKYHVIITDFVNPFDCDDSRTSANQRIEYNYIKKSPNVKTGFILHPKEKKYFIGYIKITNKNNGIKQNIASSANIEKNKEYFAEFFIDTKSSRSLEILSWDVKENIKSNNCIIFDGIIKFDKKIPVKILESE